MKDLPSIRREYSKARLDRESVLPNPLDQFEQWFNEAVNAQVPEPNAMTLSTVNEFGRPTGRIVLLKGVENNKLVFYTNYQSNKGKDIDKNPAVALTFFWSELERQVRIEGVAERLSPTRSEEYFQSRPRGSQIGAWSSPQSSVIDDRSVLEERVKQMEERFKGNEILPKPHQWGGYEVEPFVFEFWQGRESRLHDRIVYERKNDQWVIKRLAP